MRLMKLFMKKSKHGFTLVELVVVMGIMSVVTTFALSMLIAVNAHINNDLASVTVTSDLRKAQDFFEQWYRLNDKQGANFLAYNGEEPSTTQTTTTTTQPSATQPVETTHKKSLNLLYTGGSDMQNQTIRFSKTIPNGTSKLYVRAKQDGSKNKFQLWLRNTEDSSKPNPDTTIQTSVITPTESWAYYDIDKTATNGSISTSGIKSLMLVFTSAPLDGKSWLYIDEIGYYNGNTKVPLITFEECTNSTIESGNNAINKTTFSNNTGLGAKEGFITENGIYDYVGKAAIADITNTKITKTKLITWETYKNYYIDNSRATVHSKDSNGIHISIGSSDRLINTWQNDFRDGVKIEFDITPNSGNNARKMKLEIAGTEVTVDITQNKTIVVPISGLGIGDLNFECRDFSSTPNKGDVTIGDIYLYKTETIAGQAQTQPLTSGEYLLPQNNQNHIENLADTTQTVTYDFDSLSPTYSLVKNGGVRFTPNPAIAGCPNNEIAKKYLSGNALKMAMTDEAMNGASGDDYYVRVNIDASNATNIEFKYFLSNKINNASQSVMWGIVYNVNSTEKIYWRTRYNSEGFKGALNGSGASVAIENKEYYHLVTTGNADTDKTCQPLSNLSNVTALVFRPLGGTYENVDFYIDNIKITKNVPATPTTTTTTTTTKPTTTKPATTASPSTTQTVTPKESSIKVASVTLIGGGVSYLYFDVEEKKLYLAGTIPPGWSGDTFVKFTQIIGFRVEFSSDNRLVKCSCTFDEKGKNRIFSFVYSRRTT